MKNALVLVTLASCVTALCRAASPASVPESLLACRKVQDESARVRCYDSQIDKMSGSAVLQAAPAQAAPAQVASAAQAASVAQATPAAQAAPTTSMAAKAAAAAAAPPAEIPSGNSARTSAATPAQSATAQSATARFGEETLPPTSHPKGPQEDTALLSSITALHAVAPQTYVISLANGQVWRQEQASQTAMFFRVGDSACIEKAPLGSYHLSTGTTGAKNWVRVTRVQ